MPYSLFFTEDEEYTELLADCGVATLALNDPDISDPLFACQWHLGSDEWANVNVEPAWSDGFMGEGVEVAVVDDGMYHEHEDLRDNVDAELNRDYTENEDIYSPYEHHGTHVAGMIAARDNEVGVRGVAPRATIYGYNFLAPGAATLLNLLDAMGAAETTAISNNSWGPIDGPELDPAPPFWTGAINRGITRGNEGKGIFYAFAAGNGHLAGDDSNYDGVANHFGVTAVCSVNAGGSRAGYSEMGANLWVCGPSNDRPRSLGGVRGILTTENSDRYYNDFGGTSAATPIVAGIAALMRGANPELTWRDLKLILAATAQKNDAASSGWEDGARKYRAALESDRYHFNHEYGFGLADAAAAVDMAQGWTNAPPAMAERSVSEWDSVEVPDAPESGEPETVERTVTIDTSMGFTEFVEVTLAFQHDAFRDLEVELVSPSGAVSRLSAPFDTYTGLSFFFDPFVPLHGAFRFGSARHLGEDPNGEWTLRVTDRIPGIEGVLGGMALTVYGHERAPGAPAEPSVEVNVEGEALTVRWAAAVEAGDSAVSSYDVRHIETGEDETVGSNWTVAEAWTSDAGGELEYTIRGLTDGMEYGVQVRAVNDSGGGLWSGTVAGTPMTNACVPGGAVADGAEKPGLARDCEALLEARDTLAGTATLDWTADTPIAEWEGVGIGGGEASPRVVGLVLKGKGLDGSIPASLGRLSALTVLNLRSNDLTGSIPSELNDLGNLTVLNLHSNMLSGQVTDLSGTKLEELYLPNNRLTGSIPAWLNTMTDVRELWLWGNELSGAIPDLSGMTGLEVLKLNGNNLTGGVPAAALLPPNAKWILLQDNPLRGTIPDLSGLTSVRTLWLHTNGLTGEIPAPHLPSSVTSLNLKGNSLRGPIPDLSGLDNLRYLRLHRNMLSGSIPGTLGDLESLERIWLHQNRLTGIEDGFADSADTLTHLFLEGNRFAPGTCLPATWRASRATTLPPPA